MRSVWDYLRAMALAQTQADISLVRQHWAALAASHAIYRDAGILREQLEHMFLVGYDPPSIAASTHVPADVVVTYEALFFCLNVFNLSFARGAAKMQSPGVSDA